jgi:hypothetical protein
MGIIQTIVYYVVIVEEKHKRVAEILHGGAEIFPHHLIKAYSAWRNIIHNLESELRMKAAILSVYPDHRFPHVPFYSTLLAVLSIAAVGLISSHVLN